MTRPAKPTRREIVKARLIAGSLCITIPKTLRALLDIEPGDRVMVEVYDYDGTIRIKKEG